MNCLCCSDSTHKDICIYIWFLTSSFLTVVFLNIMYKLPDGRMLPEEKDHMEVLNEIFHLYLIDDLIFPFDLMLK